jgi:hypothetical protein
MQPLPAVLHELAPSNVKASSSVEMVLLSSMVLELGVAVIIVSSSQLQLSTCKEQSNQQFVFDEFHL